MTTTSTTFTEKLIDKLTARGWKRWTKADKDRMYVDAEKLGLELDYYKTGNICSASWQGEGISHAEGYRMKAAKTYFDLKDGVLHSTRSDLKEAAEEVLDEVKTEVEAEEAPKEEAELTAPADMSASHMEALFTQIKEDLKNLAAAKKQPLTMDDLTATLQGSCIATPEAVQNAIHAIGYHMSLEQAARFFATIYTEQDRDAFLAAYEAAAPACYDQEADLETSAPWCCPWLTGAMGASKGDTPETLGRKAACMYYRELEILFGPDKEEGLAAKTEAAVRGYLLDGLALPEFLKPEEGILAKTAAEIAEAQERGLDDEERGRLTSEIVKDCIDTITPRVAMREVR